MISGTDTGVMEVGKVNGIERSKGGIVGRWSLVEGCEDSDGIERSSLFGIRSDQ